MSAATMTRPTTDRVRPAGLRDPLTAAFGLAGPAPRRDLAGPALRRDLAGSGLRPPAASAAASRPAPRARAVAPRATSPRTRLTRRGRVVLLVVAALLLLAAISVGRAGSQAATATENGPMLQQATVQPGETLWAVAQRIAPKNDPREVVAQLRRINHLQSSSLRVGQQLLLPVTAP
jgi:hypothetical protein